MANIFTFGPVGAGITVPDNSAQFAFLTPTIGQDNKVYVYAYAGQNLSASSNIALDASGTASASAGGYVVPYASVSGGANSITVASGQWFWARASAALAASA
jgi:hypothetical protein